MEANLRKKNVVANWKMYTDGAETRRLAKSVVEGFGIEDRISVTLCPPFPYLAMVGAILERSPISLGAQNLFPEREGAFTGEVSASMLLDVGCRYVIVGHSERRHQLGESDQFINQKVRAALSRGLDVILCVGETADQREKLQTRMVLEQQLLRGLAGVPPDSLAGFNVAYEPVWAIGSLGHQATSMQIEEAHAHIRRGFAELYDDNAARALSIYYGGSLKPESAREILGCYGVDGALVGAASLDEHQFLAIVRAGINLVDDAMVR